jgi:Uma2 family endonuclease
MAAPHIAPAQGTWTWEDLQALPEDGVRREIIGGELFEMTGPTPEHADAVRNLLFLLAPYFRALRMTFFTAPLDIFFPDASPVQPDIFALRRDGGWTRSDRGIEGAPDFVIEVLSPSTRGRDRLTKRALYQQAGVQEYWLVDVESQSVEVLALEGGSLSTFAQATGEELVRSRLFPDLTFPAADIFRDDA